MEELDLVPSAPVWEKIEGQIRKKSDRRMIVLWLPLLFLLLGGGIWMLYDSRQSDHLKQNDTAAVIAKEPASAKTLEEPPKTPIETPHQNTLTPGNKDEQSATAVPFTIHREMFSTKQPRKIKDRDKTLKDDIDGGGAMNFSLRPSGIKKSTDKSNEQKLRQLNLPASNPTNEGNPGKEDRPEKNETNKKYDTANAKQPARPVNIEEPPKKAAIAMNDEKPAEEKIDEAAVDSTADIATVAPTSSTQKKRNWTLGFTAAAGLSASSTGVGLFNATGEKMMDAAPMAAAPRPPLVNYSYVSPERPDVFASVGLIVKKQIGKKVFFNTGLIYDFLRTKTFVSAKVSNRQSNGVMLNSNLAFINTGIMLQDYYNVYHFLAIPLSLDLQPFKKLPLFVRGGVAVKRLINTNALQFEDSSKVYYYDPNAFRRTQVSTSFGLDYAVLNKKLKVLVGPEFQYALTGAETIEPGSRLYAFALRARVFLQKK